MYEGEILPVLEIKIKFIKLTWKKITITTFSAANRDRKHPKLKGGDVNQHGNSESSVSLTMGHNLIVGGL